MCYKFMTKPAASLDLHTDFIYPVSWISNVYLEINNKTECCWVCPMYLRHLLEQTRECHNSNSKCCH